MGVTEVKTLEEFKTIINGDKVAVFDFWATWCGPCKVISPIFEKFSEQYPNIAFYKVDVEDASDVSEEVGIRAMPTFMAFKQGQKIKETVGANPQALNAMLSSV